MASLSDHELADVGFSQVGGHPVIDLLNTVDWRLDPHRRGERLTEMGRVLRWCQTVGLVTPLEYDALVEDVERHSRIAAREHRQVLEFRETVYDALMTGSASSAEDIKGRVVVSLGRARLRPVDGGWGWVDIGLDLTTPLDRIARSALALIADTRLEFLRQCQDDACGWVFLDTSPRHNRRWCVASDCGNRNRARLFYNRHKDERPGQG